MSASTKFSLKIDKQHLNEQRCNYVHSWVLCWLFGPYCTLNSTRKNKIILIFEADYPWALEFTPTWLASRSAHGYPFNTVEFGFAQLGFSSTIWQKYHAKSIARCDQWQCKRSTDRSSIRCLVNFWQTFAVNEFWIVRIQVHLICMSILYFKWLFVSRIWWFRQSTA